MSLPTLHRIVGVCVVTGWKRKGLEGLRVDYSDGDKRTSGWQVTQVPGPGGLLQVIHRGQGEQGPLMTKLSNIQSI